MAGLAKAADHVQELAGGRLVFILRPGRAHRPRQVAELFVVAVQHISKACFVQHGVGGAVGHMEQRADGAAHPVHHGHRGVVEGDARFQRADGHFLTGLHVAAVLVGCRQIFHDALDGGQGEGVGQAVGPAGGVGLRCVGESVQAGGGGDLRRHRQGEAGVHHRQLRDEDGALQQHLHVFLCVVDDGELGGFRPGACGGGDGRHGGSGRRDGPAHVIGDASAAGGQRTDGLHGIQRAAAAQADEKIAPVAPPDLQARLHHFVGGFAGDIRKGAAGNARLM